MIFKSLIEPRSPLLGKNTNITKTSKIPLKTTPREKKKIPWGLEHLRTRTRTTGRTSFPWEKGDYNSAEYKKKTQKDFKVRGQRWTLCRWPEKRFKSRQGVQKRKTYTWGDRVRSPEMLSGREQNLATEERASIGHKGNVMGEGQHHSAAEKKRKIKRKILWSKHILSWEGNKSGAN